MFEAIAFWAPQITTQLGWALVQASVIAIAAYILVVLARTITPAARVHVSLLGLLLMALVPAALLVLAAWSPLDGWSWGQLFPASSPTETIAEPTNELPALARSSSTPGEMTSWQRLSIRASELFVNRVEPKGSDRNTNAIEGLSSQASASVVSVVWLVAFWGAVACVFFGLVRLLAGYWQINRIRSTSVPSTIPSFCGTWRNVRDAWVFKAM
ncbi:MAG: hypothetical protein R3C53_11140 [Pirellulaceae bacterium]